MDKIEKLSHKESRSLLSEISSINLGIIFFLISTMGWIWETVLKIYLFDKVVNSGFLYGPYLPIYGFGGVLIIVCLSRFKDKPFLVFSLSFFIAATTEYLTSIVLEQIFHTRWWDYSVTSFNFNGRVSLSGLLFFSLMGVVIIYGFVPKITKLLEKIPMNIRILIFSVLLLIFLIDLFFSVGDPNTGYGITGCI